MFAALIANGVERCHGGGISIPQIVDFHLQLGEFRSRDQLSAGVRFLDAQVRSLLCVAGPADNSPPRQGHVTDDAKDVTGDEGGEK